MTRRRVLRLQGVPGWLAWLCVAVCGPFTVSSQVGAGGSLASASATLESASSKPALQWHPGCVPGRRNALHDAFNSCLVPCAGLFPGARRHAVCCRRLAQRHRKGRAHACRQATCMDCGDTHTCVPRAPWHNPSSVSWPAAVLFVVSGLLVLGMSCASSAGAFRQLPPCPRAVCCLRCACACWGTCAWGGVCAIHVVELS